MRTAHTITIITAAVLALTACSTSGTETDSPATAPTAASGNVTVVTHDSFAVPDGVLAAFEKSSGLHVTFVSAGDAGSLVNRLILTKDAPLGDVAYGMDNTFASRAVDAGIFTPYVSQAAASADAASYAVDSSDALTAIDFSDVCLNVDLAAFSDGTPAPTTLDDLLDPEYAGMISVTNPATSSPGLAFLLATIAAKGDGWVDYWKGLKANDLRVTASWSDSYFVDFSAPNYGGPYPIVLSYASSPPSEVIDGKPTTAALLDTCFRQVEYAGVLTGARNPVGARAVIDWMLSDEFQSSVPESMYVYPVSTTVEVPEDWKTYAPLSDHPWSLDPSDIAAHRDQWIAEWTSAVGQ